MTNINIVAISAGHYPESPGVVYEDKIEHHIANNWVDNILDYYSLLNNDFQIIKIEPDDLTNKVRQINDIDPLFVVELHLNSNPGPKVRGAESLIYPHSSDGEIIARNIQDRLATLTKNRGVKNGYYQQDPSKGILYLLKKTICPAVIVEPEFIYNVNEVIGPIISWEILLGIVSARGELLDG